MTTELLIYGALAIAIASGIVGFLIGSLVANETWHRFIAQASAAPASQELGSARIPGQGEVAGDARPTFIGFNPFDEVAA